ncbi:MAG: hypothetical protein ABJZ80_12680, partial [Gilvibacter sp.]
SHDPGVTMLEMLCYAITDLGMRIDMPLEDILTSQDPLKNINKQFYKASEILPNKAVTAADYRKLFIDLDGVKNCWMRKYDKTVYVDCKNNALSYDPASFETLPRRQRDDFKLKGLYKIVVDYESDKTADRKKVDIAIKERYHANRNLCEDLVSIEAVKTHPIAVCADIEVETNADEELIHAKLLYEVNKYMATSLRFYSLPEMLAKKYTTPEIFEGPVLDNGFIDNTELAQAELRSEVRLSDIINIIMDIPGVKVIKQISMGNCEAEILNKAVICIDPDTKPLLCSKSVFNYNKDVLPLSINQDQVAFYTEQLIATDEAQKSNAAANKELHIIQGKYSDPGSYTTIQNDFPDTYGITSIGLPGNPTEQRKAQAKQLKGYLLFYDQILASYFKHLEKINQILAVNGELNNTFFTQAVQDIEGFSELVNNYDTGNDDFLTETLFDGLDNNIERRNQVLDHLIARFAERFTDYTFVMKNLYGDAANELVLRNKEHFLNDYKEVSGARGMAFNYCQQPKENLWDTQNVAGIQKRIARLLGISDYSRRHLTDSFVELYSLVDANDCLMYRWRIRDKANNIILSSSDDYYDTYLATRELYFAVLQIVQTTEHEVDNAFAQGVKEGSRIGNLSIEVSPTGKYSFNVINRDIKPYHVDHVVARRFSYYSSQETLKKAILETIGFMKYDFTEEGMFLVEHILLRPDVTEQDEAEIPFLPICADQCESCEPLDPYSYRISIVIPGFTFRFYNTDFRNYMEQVIREELPAHVLAKICWVGYREGEVPEEENQLAMFEEAFKKYLFKKTNSGQKQPKDELEQLIKTMSSLDNVYPNGRLYDCSDDVEELSGKVILGKTNLGSL